MSVLQLLKMGNLGICEFRGFRKWEFGELGAVVSLRSGHRTPRPQSQWTAESLRWASVGGGEQEGLKSSALALTMSASAPSFVHARHCSHHKCIS